MRRIASAAVSAIAPLLLAACASSSSTSPAAPASSTPASSTPASTGLASSPAMSSPPPSGAASPQAAGLPSCATSDLRVTIGSSEGAAGSTFVTLDFTNTGSGACTLYGYPGVSLTGGSPPAQIGQAAQRDTSKTPALVTLAAGATATAVVQVVQAGDYPAASCSPSPASALLVYPPNQTTSVSVPYHATACAASGVTILRVSPVTAG